MNFRHVDHRPPDSDATGGFLPMVTEPLRQFWRRNVVWILLAALGFLVLQDVFGTNGVLAMRRAQHQALREQEEIDRIHQQNFELQNRVKSLKTDPEAIERIAREQMGLARPGEYIFKIPPKATGKNGSTDPSKGSVKRH